MRPHERLGLDDPREWLNRARSNLARVRHQVAGTHFEVVRFEAQQAAEMALKAVMVLRGIDLP